MEFLYKKINYKKNINYNYESYVRMNLLSDYIISKRIRLLKEKAIETYYFANTNKSITIKRQKKRKVAGRNKERRKGIHSRVDLQRVFTRTSVLEHGTP